MDGGSIAGCPPAGGLPAGADGFPPCAQRDVNEATEGKWYRFSPAVSVGEHKSGIVLMNGRK